MFDVLELMLHVATCLCRRVKELILGKYITSGFLDAHLSQLNPSLAGED
jgi:hypothetical protein